MKIRTTNPPSSSKKSRRTAGAVLVMTLAVVALLTLLVVAFFSLSRIEMVSTQSYADGQSVKRVADSAVQVVLTQIRDATAGFPSDSSGNPDLSRPLSWAAQPGAIHTFDENGLVNIYKLYSSDAMVESGTGYDPTADAGDLDTWHNNLELFTDLNSPVLVPLASGDLVPIAPIVDVQNLVSLGGGLTYSTDGSTPDIEGFSVTPPPSYKSGDSVSPTNNPIPMPVRWIYLLKDGQMTVPNAGSGGIAQFNRSGQPVPTELNPIVSRIAFWADDESSKININTSSEGVYWDLPRTYSEEDIGKYTGNLKLDTPGLAFGQPAQKEFQRYPGHPATTSLSTVLGSVLPVPQSITAGNSSVFESYYNLTPRTSDGGSEAGTSIPASVLPVYDRRLYASEDDFLFSPKVDASGLRETNPALTSNLIKTSKFFLSAHSSAPETTLFNTPRIAIWPVNSNPSKHTAYDKLAAFCSTIGGEAYHFTRSNPRSMTEDFNSRNETLYQSLQKLTSTEIPGYGGDFETKMGADRDQILTYMFDYIRSTNPQDRSDGATSFTPIFNSVNNSPFGAGEILPIRIGSTQGFGRYPALSSPGLMFVGSAVGSGGRASEFEAVFVAEFFYPAHGMACTRSNTKWRVKGLEKLRIRFGTGAWEELNLPDDGTTFLQVCDLNHWGGRGVGGTNALQTTIVGNNFTTSGGDTRGNYSFFSGVPIKVPTDDSKKTFTIEGGHELTLEVIAADTDEVVQTSTFVFPEGEFKIPGFDSDIDSRGSGPGQLLKSADTIISLEIAGTKGNDPEPEADSTAGDKRMVAGLSNVPSTRFRAHNKYKEAGTNMAHTFTLTTGPNGTTGNSSGKLVNVPNYISNYNRNPDVDPRVGNFVTRIDGAPGEWDTGFGDQPDGAYINKPNDGDPVYSNLQGGGRYRAPYILGYNQGFAANTDVFFSPNLQVPSALMFGSLPTGVQRNRPWETLLFNPRPEDPNHPGKLGPRDHLLADLFWMPVIEPYAISTPLATSGKINMNHRIQPFDYIKRRTGLHAVLKGTKFLALEPADAQGYKPLDPAGRDFPFAPNRRRAIDLEPTLDEFDTRYDSQGVFRSPGEICEMNLIPEGESNSSMASFWTKHSLSGDNVREKPYVDIYPRLTTKTNTFKIHYKVQVLKKSRDGAVDTWGGATDSVVGETRGSTIVERYIDPNDTRMPDFASLPLNDPDANMDRYYRFRTISSSTFKP